MFAILMAPFATLSAEPVDVGSRPQLLVDEHLIESFSGGARLKLHRPRPKEIVMTFDKPWEGNTSIPLNTLRDGDTFRMYYRAENYEKVDGRTTHSSYLCLAESRDGIEWRRPDLGLVEFDGSKRNNIVKEMVFTPFLDANPNAAPEARYKGFQVTTVQPQRRLLFAHQSSDGIHWRPMRGASIMTNGVTRHAFDTVNVAFWDKTRGEYRAYIRDWKDGRRGIMTTTSQDFLNWAEPEWLAYPDASPDQLYTNMVQPYKRNPELFIGFPARYMEERGSLVEPLFMTSRDGKSFKLWEESLIRPGRNSDRWGNRCNYIWYGMLETASDLPGDLKEYSIFSAEHYYMDGGVKLRRYTYRPDGFVSVNAPWNGGELLTKPLVFEGDTLEINVSTAAAGGARVEIQDANGQPIPGFSLRECPEIFGDEVARRIIWKGAPDLASLAGKPIRLRAALKDADLFSFQFTGSK